MMDKKPKYDEKGYGRYSKSDIEYIKKVFGGDENDTLLKFLRKIFLPGLDSEATIGQLVDPWSASSDGKDVSKMTPEECKIYFMSRDQLLKHLELQLQGVKYISQMEEESPIERAMRQKQDSNR